MYVSAIKPFLSSDANTRCILTRLWMRLTKEAVARERGSRPLHFSRAASRGRCFENSLRRPWRQNTIHVSRIPSARSSAILVPITFHFRGRNDVAAPKRALVSFPGKGAIGYCDSNIKFNVECNIEHNIMTTMKNHFSCQLIWSQQSA